MRPNNVKYYNDVITRIYDETALLIEYIEYVDNKDKGYRVESKKLFGGTIDDMNKNLGLKLIYVSPTLDRTVIATYHFKENRK